MRYRLALFETSTAPTEENGVPLKNSFV